MSKWAYTLLFCWTIIFANGYNFLGGLEGYMNPVVENFLFTTVLPQQDSILLYGTFDKVRDCTFISMYGTISKDKHVSHIQVIFEEKSKVRTPGAQEFGPWRVKIDQEYFKDMQLFAIHDCHSGYLTRTKVL